ncbi:hypothetical protein BDV19DRAFT_354905 [Aspergillus venezuelensis]
MCKDDNQDSRDRRGQITCLLGLGCSAYIPGQQFFSTSKNGWPWTQPAGLLDIAGTKIDGTAAIRDPQLECQNSFLSQLGAMPLCSAIAIAAPNFLCLAKNFRTYTKPSRSTEQQPATISMPAIL